ncbi:MAG: amino acid permease, partial [Cytophagales bacterium]|nr:amino acid permease [Cytophagales bacterium]
MDRTQGKANFGTAPVFFTSISTILGAVMFLRFGYAVGNVGFIGTLGIILFGHLVTIPTAMAIAEIATNQKVEGGGKYYIISRSFGINVGAAIGLALYLSQAISVSFYLIAFAEAFDPVFNWITAVWGLENIDKRIISLPATLALSLLMIRKGADLGMKALYAVVAVLFLSIILFLAGTTEYQQGLEVFDWTVRIGEPDNFFLVFAIVFPAFTGMTAGVGLSGDLKDPKKSI